MADLTQQYENLITRYSIFLYTDNGLSIYLGDTVEFGYTIQRDKMPVPVLGNKNLVTIVRKGRLATGYFTRFLENGVDMQRKLIEATEDESGITQFGIDTAVIELIKRSLTTDDNSAIIDLFKLNITDGSNTVEVKDSTLIRRKSLRLGDFENIHILVVGSPEIVNPSNPVTTDDGNSYLPDKLMIARFKDCVFQGESINISIDNPNIIEQVSFISTQATFYNKLITLS